MKVEGTITPGPMIETGMPGITMVFVIDPSVDAAALSRGEARKLLLRRNADFSMTLVGVAP